MGMLGCRTLGTEAHSQHTRCIFNPQELSVILPF